MELAFKKSRVDSCVHSRISQIHKVSKLEGALGIICAQPLETLWSETQIWMKISLISLTSFVDLCKSHNPSELMFLIYKVSIVITAWED